MANRSLTEFTFFFFLSFFFLTKNRHVDATVRLVGGDAARAGRVEIFHRGSWGAVCDDRWDVLDAEIVCRQLGFLLGAEAATKGSFYGESDLPIVMSGVSCKGTESRLADCPFVCTNSRQCNRSNEAGVICKPCKDTALTCFMWMCVSMLCLVQPKKYFRFIIVYCLAL